MLDILAEKFTELNIDILGKRNSGLTEYRLTVRPSAKFIEKHQVYDDTAMSTSDVSIVGAAAATGEKETKKKKPKKKKTKKPVFNESFDWNQKKWKS